MAKSKQSKSETLSSLRDKLGRMKAVVFTHYQGMSVKDITDLRKQLRHGQVDFLVVKKTLLKKALPEAGFNAELVDQLAGDVATAFGYDDEIAPAKILSTFAKQHPQVQLLAGLMNGQTLNTAEVNALAKLPSREELLAKTVWVIKGPLTGLANVLSGNLRGLVQVLSAIKDRQPAAT